MSARTATHRRPRPTSKVATRVTAMTVTGSLSAVSLVLAAGSASADTTPNSQSEGRFLDGRSGGINIDNLANLAPANAVNNGGATVTEVNPLTATVLNSIVVPIGPVNLLGTNGILDLGAVNQVAIARANGSSLGASGAVGNDGAINVGGSNQFPGNATLHLGGLLGGSGVLDNLDLSVGALSARANQAAGAHGKQTSSYQIADLKLRLDSTVLSGLLAPLLAQQSQIDGVAATLAALAPTGAVAVGPLPDISAILANIVGADGVLGNGLLTVNLTNGVITVDLGSSLNNLPPNTPVLTAITSALGGLDALVGGALDQLQTQVDTALQNVIATVALPAPGGGVLPAIPLPGASGVLATLIGALDLTPAGATSGLLDDNIDTLLANVLALTANVQAEPPNTQKPAGSGIVDEFTVSALRINVLGSTAVVDLASASVGSNFGPSDEAVAPVAHETDGQSAGNELPATGANSVPVGAAGLALLLAGVAMVRSQRPITQD
jgi:hypothetical protein